MQLVFAVQIKYILNQIRLQYNLDIVVFVLSQAYVKAETKLFHLKLLTFEDRV